MTRNQFVKLVKNRLRDEYNINLTREEMIRVINVIDDEIYMAIANSDKLVFSWGTIYGGEKVPKRLGGIYAEGQYSIENYGYSSWKVGYPFIKWNRATQVNDCRPAKEYFDLPENRYTTEAREFRQHAKLPEIPEYEDLPEEEILRLCKKADDIKLEGFSQTAIYEKEARDKHADDSRRAWALFWETYDYKPFRAANKYYTGEQRDGVASYLDRCLYNDELDLTLPQQLEVVRRALDMVEYKHLEDVHGERLRKIEKDLVKKVKKQGLKELEHSKIRPNVGKLRRNLHQYDIDEWGVIEETKTFHESVFEKYNIDPQNSIDEYTAKFRQAETFEPGFIEKLNKEYEERQKKIRERQEGIVRRAEEKKEKAQERLVKEQAAKNNR